jgi:IS1 family transposase
MRPAGKPVQSCQKSVSRAGKSVRRIPNRFQLTTDGWQVYSGYTGAVREVFGTNIDYATEIKHFGRRNPAAGWRLSPLKLIAVTRSRKINRPRMSQATTSHAERTNLSVRTFNRRFTRCTIGYSKKLDNLKHAVALFVWHFNFVRQHSAHGLTPAQSAKLTENPMTIEDLISCTN